MNRLPSAPGMELSSSIGFGKSLMARKASIGSTWPISRALGRELCFEIKDAFNVLNS